MITNINKQNYNDVEGKKWIELYQLLGKLKDISIIMDDVHEMYEKQVDEEAQKWWNAMGAIWEMEAQIENQIINMVEKEALKLKQGGQHEIIQKC